MADDEGLEASAHLPFVVNSLIRAPRISGVPYSGLSLDTGGREIRILHLHSSITSVRLSGRLEVVSLGNAPPYDALSYTWGPRTLNKFILVNNRWRLPLTDNLYRAIRRLRYQCRNSALWIDAICINQDDVEERNQQVSFMGDIYAAASQVCVWLGDSSFSFSRTHWLRPLSLRLIPMRTYSWYKALALGHGTFVELADRLLHRPLHKAIALYLDAFYALVDESVPRWHERAWIVQELYWSRKVLWCFGPRQTYSLRDWLATVEPEDFGHRLPFIRLDSVVRRVQIDLKEHYKRKFVPTQAETESTNGLHSVPIFIIMETSYTHASEPRDKVYSLRSMIGDPFASRSQPNYCKPTVEVFAEATYASMIGSVGLEAFHLVNATGERRMQRLPSWAIDFTFDGFDPSTHPNLIEQWMPSLLPGDKSLPTASPCLQDGSTFLRVTAILFDTITHSHPDLRWNNSNSDDHCSEIAGMLEGLVRKFYVDCHSPKTAFGKVPWRDDFVREEQFVDAIIGSATSTLQSMKDPPLGATGIFEWWDRYIGSPTAGIPWGGFLQGKPEPPSPYDEWSSESENRNYDGYARAVGGRGNFFTLTGGFLGRCTGVAEPGDIVVLASGCKLPILLRQRGDAYAFRGLVFIHGIGDVVLEPFWEANGTEGTRITLF